MPEYEENVQNLTSEKTLTNLKDQAKRQLIFFFFFWPLLNYSEQTECTRSWIALWHKTAVQVRGNTELPFCFIAIILLNIANFRLNHKKWEENQFYFDDYFENIIAYPIFDLKNVCPLYQKFWVKLCVKSEINKSHDLLLAVNF